jgi:hypothetical protein
VAFLAWCTFDKIVFLSWGFQYRDLCAHCGKREDLEHMFLYCSRFSNLLELVRDVMAGVIDTASVTTEIYVLGPWMGGFSPVSWPVHLATWIATQAKLATYVTSQIFYRVTGRPTLVGRVFPESR